MRTYTEEDIKKYFDIMINKYPNSKTKEHFEMVKFIMFPSNPKSWGEEDSLEKILDTICLL